MRRSLDALVSRTVLAIVLGSLALGVAPARGAGTEAPAGLAERRFLAAQAGLAGRARKPEAVADLALLVSLAGEVGSERVRASLEKLATDPEADPLVVAQASYQLALFAAGRGDDEAARQQLAALGLIDRFSVVGPFDAAGRGGLAQSFPPEEPGGAPAPGRRFTGKEREVAWRIAAGAEALGALVVDGLLRPDKDAAAYVLFYVSSARARAAVLRVGSPGPIKVWAGGRVVLTHDVLREARFDQDAAAVALPAGETAFLVKTVALGGAWRLFARLTDPAGRPLTGVSFAATGKAPLVSGGKGGAGAGTKSTTKSAARELGALLRTRVEAAASERAAASLDYARWLGFSHQADREGKAEEAALERAAKLGAGGEVATDALLLLGARATEEDDRRRAYERALATGQAGSRDDARKAVALFGLGELARAKRRDSDALARFRAALQADPGNLDATLALAAEEENLGLPALALQRVLAVAAPARDTDRARLARARLLETLGRRAEAEHERQAVWQHRHTDLELGLALARAARDRGDLPAAIALHVAVSRYFPELTFLITEWARMLEGQGQFAEARRRLEALTVRLPDEASVWEELGRLLIRGDKIAEGAAALRRALTLRPQNPTLRRYLARLEGELHGEGAETGDDLVRSFTEDGEALAGPALAGKLTPFAGGGGTDVLLDKQVVRVHRNGLSERFVQRLVLVRTEQAAREALEQGIRYTPGSQEVEVRRARIYRRGPGADAGVEIIEAAGRDDRDLSEPWYGLYYDVRAEVVLYEGLRPGDVIELSYTLSDVSFENVLRDYFGDLELIGEAAPRRRWEYVLLGPAERKFYFNQPALPGLVRSDERRGDETLIRFTAHDIPPAIGEPGMPGWTEVVPYLHVSTFAGWQDVGRWYWGLVADQLAADEPLREAVRGAIAEAGPSPAPLAKVRALHRLVLESTRYVGLEFGIHGYKPYKVTQVMSRRFGDCKDKASLLHVLLREAGIDSEIVLLRTRRSGRVAPFPASLAVFDHAIVYVPQLQLYLDGTAEFSGMKELPAEDQGVMVLRVGKGGVTLADTPMLPAEDNLVQRRWDARLDDKGGARIEEQISVSGQAAPEWREHYETPGERQERYARVWDSRFPGATLESVEIEGVEDRNRPVVARSVALVPELCEAGPAGEWRLPIAAREPDLVRSYARLSAPRHEFVLGYPFRHEERLRFELPAGWSVGALPTPASKRIESPFGRFALDVTVAPDGRSVEVASRTEITRNRIPPSDYAAFRAFLGQLDAVLRQSVVVHKAGAS